MAGYNTYEKQTFLASFFLYILGALVALRSYSQSAPPKPATPAEAGAGTEGTPLRNAAARAAQAPPIVDRSTRHSLRQFSRRVAFAMLLRAVWLACNYFNVFPKVKEGEDTCHNAHTFLSGVNRLAQLTFFIAFSSIVAFWAELGERYELARSRRRGLQETDSLAAAMARSSVAQASGVVASGALLPAARNADRPQGALALLAPQNIKLLVNFWVTLTLFVLLTLQWQVCDANLYNSIYEAETVTIAVFFALLSGAFLYFGLKVRRAAGETSVAHNPAVHRVRRYLLVLCVVCPGLFLLRGALFLVRPVTGYNFTGVAQTVLYPWFFYPVPELVPSLLMVWYMWPGKKPPAGDEVRPATAAAAVANGHGPPTSASPLLGRASSGGGNGSSL